MVHYRTMEEVAWQWRRSAWLGDEVDLKVQYDYEGVLQLYFDAGVLLLRAAYDALVNPADESRGAIIEVMAGLTINY